MRILMLGVLGIATKRNIQGVLDEGHEVIYVGKRDPFALGNAYNLAKLPPYNFRFIPFWGDLINPQTSGYDLTSTIENCTNNNRRWIAAVHIRWLVFRFKPDVIHVQAINWISESCAIAKVHPLVVSAWGFLNHLMIQDYRVAQSWQSFVAQTLENADAVIVETPSLVDKTKSLLKPSGQVALIPLGVDTKRFCPASAEKVSSLRRNFKISADAKVILSPRSWSPGYGQIDIMKAFGMAQKDFHYPTVIAFLALIRGGSVPAFEAQMQQVIADFELEDKICFLPRLPYSMMPLAYQLADVVVNYPHRDAFGSTLMEAVACQIPLISADLPGYQNTFVREYASLVESKNPAALASAMTKVINLTPEANDNTLKRARKVMLEQYEESIAQKKLVAVYQNVAS